MSTRDSRHSYTGRSVDERRAERRALFFDAGLTVFAETSYAASSITDICAAAGLSRRQFYEQYADREALLLDVYNTIQRDARTAVVQALADVAQSADLRELMTVALTAYTHAIGDDARRAKVAFVEIVGVSPEVERYRAEVRAEWGTLVESATGSLPGVGIPPGGWRAAMAAFVGAVNGLVHQWSLDDPRPPLNVLVEVLLPMLSAITIDVSAPN